MNFRSNFMYNIHIQICIQIDILAQNQNKKKIVCEISEMCARVLKNEDIHAQILNKKRNLCTNLN